MDRPWRSAELATTAVTGSLLDFFVWAYMRNMVYERKVCTRDELLQRIFDVAARVNDAALLRKVTLSIAERVRLWIQADGCHFEHFLN